MKFVLTVKGHEQKTFVSGFLPGGRRIGLCTREQDAKQYSLSEARKKCERYPDLLDYEPTMALPGVWNF